MKNFSTTNFVLIVVTFATVGFIIVNIFASAKGIKIEIDPLLWGFFSSLLWFVIGKKAAKIDWSKFTKEEEKKIPSDNKDEQIDQLLNLTK